MKRTATRFLAILCDALLKKLRSGVLSIRVGAVATEVVT